MLHYSVMFSLINVTKILIELFNADPNIKNKMGICIVNDSSEKVKIIYFFISISLF